MNDNDEVRRGFRAVWDSTLPPGRLLCGRVTGSRAYGTATPASDWDWGGVFLAPTARVLSLDWKKEDETASYTKGDGEDWTFHEAKKFLGVLESANANTLEALFMPADAVVPGDPALQPFWDELVAHRREFLTPRVIVHYLAYARSQLTRARGEPVRESKKRPNKPVDRQKDASHGLRLLFNARQIARGEEPQIRLTGSELAAVQEVRFGAVADGKAVLLADRLEAEIRSLEPWPVRAAWPLAFANDWLLRVRRFDFTGPAEAPSGASAPDTCQLMYQRGRRDGAAGLSPSSTGTGYMNGYGDGRRARIENALRAGDTLEDRLRCQAGGAPPEDV